MSTGCELASASFQKKQKTLPRAWCRDFRAPLTQDGNILDCCPSKASGRVMDEAGIGSAMVSSDVGDKEIL